MKCIKLSSMGAVVFGLTTVGVAQAGPQVTITLKNNGNVAAVYDVVGSSALSYADASPKPLPKVNAGNANIYSVKGKLSPDFTTAFFQYRMGAKVCKFKTSYMKARGRSGAVPKWYKTSEPSGGARCDVRVTSTDTRSHDWSVVFTMR